MKTEPHSWSASPDRDRVFQRHAEGFLTEDRLAGPRRGQNRLGVQMVRQADIDRVKTGFRQHRIEIGVGRHFAVAAFRREMRRPLGRHVSDRGHHTPRGVLLPGASVHVAHPARANDADFKRIHAISTLPGSQITPPRRPTGHSRWS